ncbi:MAG: molybdopterin-dependent oxidoreductase [Gammaproteobacteria bacterium]
MNALVSTTQTTCPYCGVGCGVEATRMGNTLTAVAGDPAHPANHGRLCVKGSALHDTLGEQGRLLHPRIGGMRTDWSSALDHVAAGLRNIITRHGPDAVAFYLSGQLLTEDYYVANKLMKGFIGSANVDTNSRLCMASAVASYKRAFGADAVPCSYEDLECCDLLVMIGSNAAWTHPILYQRIRAARQNNPAMRIVLIDPRRTATCEIADLHLPLLPGSDAFLFQGLLHDLHRRQALDSSYIDAHTEGFEEALRACTPFDVENTARQTGLDVGQLEQFFAWFARTEKTVTFYSQGINQSATGTDKCNAIINCHLATGRIGRPGMGPFSITGQPNAMGGREVGGLANQLAAHMDFDAANVERVTRFWKAPNIATKPGLKAVDLFEGIAEGRVKAVWIMATNPVVSLPDSERVREALRQCELVIVSDCIAQTDTTALAHVLLPAAGWGEKDGSVTNSERRISRQRALLPPMGEAKPDWWIVCEVARRLGFNEAFAYTRPSQIFAEHAALSGFENEGSRAFDISGLSALDDHDYNSLQAIQWPVNATHPQGTARLFTDACFFTPSGRARFVTAAPALPERPLQFDTPFILNTGRIRDQWHTMTRTARSPRLMAHTESPTLALNPRDAQSLGIRAGDLLKVYAHTAHSGTRQLLMQASIDPGLRDGETFAPIHWNDQFSSHGRISSLLDAVTDPVSGQPESKFARIGLRPVQVRQWATVLSREPLDTRHFRYWVRTPVAGGHITLIAGLDEDANDGLQAWRTGLDPVLEKIELSNSISGSYRALLCHEAQIQFAVFISPRRSGLPDTQWLQTLLQHTVGEQSWRLLARQESHEIGTQRIICSCFRVSEQAILDAIREGVDSVETLGKRLRCGSNCGSCIPELEQLLNRQH